MNTNLYTETIKLLQPNHIFLELTEEDKKIAYLPKYRYTNEVAHHNAYLNQLCLNKVINWLENESIFTEKPEIYPDQDSIKVIWEFLNGTAIKLGETKLILIPSEMVDNSEFMVQAEWVESHQLKGDYYIACYLNLVESYLEIWGYTTHKTLSQKENYDAIERAYIISREQIIDDLNIIQTAKELNLKETGVIPSYLSLGEQTAMNLIEKLSEPSLYSPRFNLPFSQWLSLIEKPNYRDELYKQRRIKSHWLTASIDQSCRIVNKFINENWQILDEMRAKLELQGVRSHPQTGIKGEPQTISDLIKLLEINKNDLIIRNTANVLGEIAFNNQDAINALIKIIKNTDNERTRWEVSSSLQKIDPGNDKATIKRARKIDFGLQIQGFPLALSVVILPLEDKEFKIRILLECVNPRAVIPPELILSIIDNGQEYKAIATGDKISGGKDKMLQLIYQGKQGDYFQVKVAYEGNSLIEDFLI